MTAIQLPLFTPAAPSVPPGFTYRPDLISPAEESSLLACVADLPFKPFEFGPYVGKRRIVSFGWRYDFGAHALDPTEAIPDFLLPLRHAAAAFADLPPEQLPHAMITEYAPGAPIGWHRDRPEFGEVVGVSLLSPCVFRFRRKLGAAWERISRVLEPRSAYVLRGPARAEWMHSIPPMTTLRYSVTFRSLSRPAAPRSSSKGRSGRA